MKFTAFGVTVEVKNPAYPYAQPQAPAQSIHITSGQAIYTTTHADIDPQTLDLTIRRITTDQNVALSDFIVHVIEFSSHPCRIETGLEVFDNMHLIGGWERIVTQRGDKSNVVLRFREGSDSLPIGKNLVPWPRLFGGQNLRPEWSLTGRLRRPTVPSGDSPFGYSQRVLRMDGGVNIKLVPQYALPLVGTDLRITATVRYSVSGRSLSGIRAEFYATNAQNARAVRDVALARPAGNSTGDWQTLAATMREDDFPGGANFFTPKFTSPSTYVELAQLTAEYLL